MSVPQARLIQQLLRGEQRPSDLTPYEKAEADNWLSDLISKRTAAEKGLQDSETARTEAEASLTALQAKHDLLSEWAEGLPTWESVERLKARLQAAEGVLRSHEETIRAYFAETPTSIRAKLDGE